MKTLPESFCIKLTKDPRWMKFIESLNKLLIEIKIWWFLKKETKETTASLWGQKLTFRPALLKEKIGDGRQIIYVGTIDQRPAYWLVRIDSKTDINSPEFDFHEILYKLEDEFGRIDDDSFETEDEVVENNLHYPSVYYSGGHWGLVKNFIK